MKILLIGYGKMGKTIEELALSKGHEIAAIVRKDGIWPENLNSFDVAIEFTQPEAAPENILKCIENELPVVSGTTGWNKRFDEITSKNQELNGSFFYASNFSIGVNLFFELSKTMSQLFAHWPEYALRIEEIHHIHKKDSPSGTAITLAEKVLQNNSYYTNWAENPENQDSGVLPIHSSREGEVIGTHSLVAENDIDIVSLKHHAKNRKGFAAGAILAAEFIADKKGYFTMSDLLNKTKENGN